MAEIKSTLEIIMEKTKGMTISEDEKKEFRKKEVRGKVGGVIQRWLDGIINQENLQIELTNIGKDNNDILAQVVMEESVPRIRLGQENSTIMKVFEITEGIDAGRIKEIIDSINQELVDKRIESEGIIMKRLKESGVSGSAVMPNPDADPDFIEFFKMKSLDLKERLKGIY